MGLPSPFFVTAARGLTGPLAQELRALGCAGVVESRTGCSFHGDLEDAYRVCLWSRVASRVLAPLAEVEAPDAERLYAGVRALPWELHVDPAGTLAVDLTATRSPIGHTGFATLRVKDAVVDRLREYLGSRPSVDTVRPDVRINVHCAGETAVVSIDLSGAALHRRGYREEGVQVQAPLKETLAAGVLLRGGWPEIAAAGGAFLDPMCGAGTLPVEAALLAADIAPGSLRGHWGFQGWLQHRPDAWSRLVAEAEARRAAGLRRVPPIYGCDADARAVRLARAAVDRAGLSEIVSIERRPLAGLPEVFAGSPLTPGLVAVNPPYGERLGRKADLGPLYAELGRVLRSGFLGWRAAVLAADLELTRWTGMRAHKKYALFNGALEVKLLLFDVRPERFAGGAGRRGMGVTPAGGPAGGPEATPSSAAGADGPVGPDGARGEPAEPDGVRGEPAEPAPAPAPAGAPRPAPSSPTPASGSRRAGVDMLADRLRKNQRRLRGWARREGVTCYRLYDADLPEYAVAIDLYEDLVHVQEYQPPASVDPARAQARLRDVMDAVAEVLGAGSDRVFLKVRRRQRGTSQYERLADGDDLREVGEGGLRFLVDLAGRLDTGLFLDHRITRSLVRDLVAPGGRFLNLFAYTGTATVYAAAGGAGETVSVDLSRPYLTWAARNLSLNGFAPSGPERWTPGGGGPPGGARGGVGPSRHRLVQADCLEWLRHASAEASRPGSARYRLVFLDPPTFSNSKRMGESVLDVQRDHVEMITAVAALLEPGGTLLFSTNSRRFRLDEAALADYDVQDVTGRTIPPDFARHPRIHSCWVVRPRQAV